MGTSNNKRLAKNTAFLYLRMLIVMLISIYTVRVVLENLGIVNYGVYNVVGGISSAFIFFQSALTNATQRFLNFELGTKNTTRLGQIFNLSLEIYIIIAFIILAIGILLGKWFIINRLSIPTELISAACIVLYLTLISLVFSFISAVYEAVLISHENMKIYAYIGLFDAVAKLLVAYLIVITPFNRLISYAFLLTCCTIIPKIITIIYCKKHYIETSLKPYWNKILFKEIFSFSGWNIYGTAVWMINQQGINILLNLFFGPVVNAARGISFQVTNVINNFVNNFFTAVRPQIIKTYAAKEYSEFINLIFVSSRFSVYLIWLFFLPIFFRIDYILSIWLKAVPDYSAIFIRWVLIYMLIDSLNNPLWSAIQAVGKLKKTILYGSSFFLLVFPLSYIFLKIGFKPWIVYPILIAVRIIYLVVVFKILNTYILIDCKEYLRSVIFRLISVCVVSFITLLFINRMFNESFLSLCLVSAISVVINSAAILLIGLKDNERKIVIDKLKNVINKIKAKH
ncbi:MATE family efflux transporter [uncultured Duncaniella sp.]|uniref:MATE family efflux transporter n=2 Tax=uncultured Duncaniella sp. TaxID=2768039 RepID=UPI0027120FD8|nr:MATE family efflux transporter [uncultured Duncaniella sp.]